LAALPPRTPNLDWSLRGRAFQLRTTFQGVWTMTTPRRLNAAGAAIALLAAATCPLVWGDAANPAPRKLNLAAAIHTPADGGATADVGGRFAQQPVVTYQTLKGELHFALQLKADLPPAPPRPRDVAVVIDTSASQAGRPLQNARLVLEELNK